MEQANINKLGLKQAKTHYIRGGKAPKVAIQQKRKVSMCFFVTKPCCAEISKFTEVAMSSRT